MVKEFQFLVAKTKTGESRLPRTKANTVMKAYSRKELKNLIVLWSDRTMHYYVFDSMNELEKFLRTKTALKEDNFFEVIWEDDKQRLRLDLDNRVSEADFREIMTEAIKPAWEESKFHRPNTRILVFQTNPVGYHVVIERIVDNIAEAREFAEEVISRAPARLRSKIDTNIYHSVQTFRMPGAWKSKDRTMFKKELISKGPRPPLKEQMIRVYDL